MDIEKNNPPREFQAGAGITIKDCAHIKLAPDEQVTFITESGGEYDVARKQWGFYATPSLNCRLPSFGLRPALVRNSRNQHYIFLLEEGKEDPFEAYCKNEAQEVVCWLDKDDDLGNIDSAFIDGEQVCPVCSGKKFAPVFRYDAPPEGETIFTFSDDGTYHREIKKCATCGHFISICSMDISGIYKKEYVDSTYGEAMKATYDRIMALPEDRSDNMARVKRVNTFAKERFDKNLFGRKLLDVGAGLGVFPARMKEDGWDIVALDPDRRSAKHLREVVGVDSVCTEIADMGDMGAFDLITFNKVLEHIEDPLPVLADSRSRLTDGGLVYIELPDGEAAVDDGSGREEFFVEHHHIFSMASLSLLAGRAGFRVLNAGRVKEPSSKYTLWAFLENNK